MGDSAQILLSEETAQQWLLGKTSLVPTKVTALALASQVQLAPRGTVGFLVLAVFIEVGLIDGSAKQRDSEDCL